MESTAWKILQGNDSPGDKPGSPENGLPAVTTHPRTGHPDCWVAGFAIFSNPEV
jgi:hypothetical protein